MQAVIKELRFNPPRKTASDYGRHIITFEKIFNCFRRVRSAVESVNRYVGFMLVPRISGGYLGSHVGGGVHNLKMPGRHSQLFLKRYTSKI